ncbi:unnamed protein product, partial [Symbiodinium sp. KB8]
VKACLEGPDEAPGTEQQLTVHLRGNDLWNMGEFELMPKKPVNMEAGAHHWLWANPPCTMYEKIIREEGFTQVLIVTSPDRRHACVPWFENFRERTGLNVKITLQTNSLAEDFCTLARARNLVLSFSTLSNAAAIMSKRVKRVYLRQFALNSMMNCDIWPDLSMVQYSMPISEQHHEPFNNTYAGVTEWMCCKNLCYALTDSAPSDTSIEAEELPMLLPGGLGMTVSSEPRLQKLPAAAPDYGRPRKGGLKAAKWMKPRLMAEEESSSRGRQQSDTRWWTKLQEQLLCPLSGFPIRLLPYPPFKLRVDCSKPGPHFLLDGKFLAMKLIVDGRPGEGIRDLETSDLLALDDYIQRCKLGPFRPGTARALQQEIATAKTESDRIRAVEELKKMQQRTKTELGKLRRIQDNRLSQLKTDLK